MGRSRARITFFSDGTDTELLSIPSTASQNLRGDDSAFNLTVEVILGQTIQRLQRILDSNSSCKILTPGMELAARGTVFAVRVEERRAGGDAGERRAGAGVQKKANADVPPEFVSGRRWTPVERWCEGQDIR
ncbi:MAG: hypothetical protein IPK52_16005 [Chloroflexi bacterium]|nr:hypothetical protein [Chloroflexota bacterium]